MFYHKRFPKQRRTDISFSKTDIFSIKKSVIQNTNCKPLYGTPCGLFTMFVLHPDPPITKHTRPQSFTLVGYHNRLAGPDFTRVPQVNISSCQLQTISCDLYFIRTLPHRLPACQFPTEMWQGIINSKWIAKIFTAQIV